MNDERLLPYEVYYESSVGERLYLDREPFLLTESELFDTRWRLSVVELPAFEGCHLLSGRRECREITLKVQAAASDRLGLAQLLGSASDIFDRDIIYKTAGKLYVNGQYLRCWCGVSEKKLSCDTDRRALLELTITPESPVWYTERHYSILPEAAGSADGLKYPYNYPKRYGAGRHMVIARNTHFAAAPVRVTFFGAAEEPAIMLGTQRIGLDITLAAGEYAVIDQRTREVYKIGTNGVRVNCFDARDKNGGVFKYLPSGNNMLTLDSSGGADIILYEQRSEPVWSLS